MDRCTPFFRPGIPGLIPDAWIVPGQDAPATAPVVAIHGISRNVEEMVEHLLPRARATRRTLVVPHFTQAHWPLYQRAACSRRADWALLRLMAALVDEALIGEGRFDLSGFSGGAQFAHRFTWLYPHAVGRLCATAPGWWTFPDRTAVWPYGTGTAPGQSGAQAFRLTANLRGFLHRRIVVCVGSDDTARDGSLRQGDDIDAQQGLNRVERAYRWCAAAEAAARAEGLTPNIALRILPDCGHRFAECVARGGLDTTFVAPADRCTGCGRAGACRAHFNVFAFQTLDQTLDQTQERTAA